MVGKVFAEIKVIYVERLPIIKLNLSNQKEKRIHDEILEFVKSIEVIKKKSESCKVVTEKEFYTKQIEFIDNMIDKLIYDLYNLTDEEIAVIKASN